MPLLVSLRSPFKRPFTVRVVLTSADFLSPSKVVPACLLLSFFVCCSIKDIIWGHGGGVLSPKREPIGNGNLSTALFSLLLDILFSRKHLCTWPFGI